MSDAQTMSVPSTTAGVRLAADAVHAFGVRLGLPDDLRRAMLTTLDEVMSNVVRHALAGRAGAIDVTMACQGAEVRLEVADGGPPFNPLLAPAPDTAAPLEARQAGGLGIALVRALTDDVGYERRDHRNHLTMRWRRDAGESRSRHAD
jgi:serine/threonine-protein kinase RsbW